MNCPPEIATWSDRLGIILFSVIVIGGILWNLRRRT